MATMKETYEGWPCSDFTCGECGKVHTAPRLMPGEHCPRCGARVDEVEYANGRKEARL